MRGNSRWPWARTNSRDRSGRLLSPPLPPTKVILRVLTNPWAIEALCGTGSTVPSSRLSTLSPPVGHRTVWVYENTVPWASPSHFYSWKLTSYSQLRIHPIHHNFVPENSPAEWVPGTCNLGMRFGSTSRISLHTSPRHPMSIASLPVDFCPTYIEGGTTVSYCILPNLVHYLSSITRQTSKDLATDAPDSISPECKRHISFLRGRGLPGYMSSGGRLRTWSELPHRDFACCSVPQRDRRVETCFFAHRFRPSLPVCKTYTELAARSYWAQENNEGAARGMGETRQRDGPAA